MTTWHHILVDPDAGVWTTDPAPSSAPRADSLIPATCRFGDEAATVRDVIHSINLSNDEWDGDFDDEYAAERIALSRADLRAMGC